MRRMVWPVGVLLAVLAVGCGGSAGKAPPAAGAVPSASASAAVRPRDAAAVVAALKAAGLPIGSTVTYTAATDPNHLLGRPNGYVSKTAFADTRVDASQVTDNSTGSVDLGGSVEMFADAGAAGRRAAYIVGVERSMPSVGTEYDYTAGTVLLRVSSALTPDEAKQYAAALHRVAG